MQDLDMYYDEYFPFYAAYANPMLYQGERMQEEEFELMKSYYPGLYRKFRKGWRKNAACWIMREAGYMMNILDKYMFYHLCSKIKESMKPEIKAQAEQSCFLDELVHVLLGQEICRRRCRRKRCRGTFYHW